MDSPLTWKVWDELNSAEEHAEEYPARDHWDADDAACHYAEQDADGQTDGLYQKPHNLLVRSPAGELFRCPTQLDWDPVGHVQGVERLGGGA
ncbi:MAG TPA: hypothetical protein VLC09_20120 [Polyangiaceae bacterium]|nr:hypothetical protein [Polyangiaceae bacterium]